MWRAVFPTTKCAVPGPHISPGEHRAAKSQRGQPRGVKASSDNSILGEKSAERWNTGERQCRDDKVCKNSRSGTSCARHILQRCAIVIVLKYACAQKQRALDCRMGDEVQQSGHRHTCTHSDKHQAVLARHRGCQHALEIAFSKSYQSGYNGGYSAHQTHHQQCLRRQHRCGADQQDGANCHQCG